MKIKINGTCESARRLVINFHLFKSNLLNFKISKKKINFNFKLLQFENATAFRSALFVC